MNKAEYSMLGVVLVEYRDAVQLIDGCLTTAVDISKTVDPRKAAAIEAMRLAALQALDVIDGCLAEGPRES